MSNGSRSTGETTQNAYLGSCPLCGAALGGESAFIVAFCPETDGTLYEAAQSDIFDHILTAVPEFELRVRQAL